MNSTDDLLRQLLNEVKNNSSTPLLVLQGITLGLLILKPVMMYFIQAKYNAPPPHASILRNVDDNQDTATTSSIKTYQNDIV